MKTNQYNSHFVGCTLAAIFLMSAPVLLCSAAVVQPPDEDAAEPNDESDEGDPLAGPKRDRGKRAANDDSDSKEPGLEDDSQPRHRRGRFDRRGRFGEEPERRGRFERGGRLGGADEPPFETMRDQAMQLLSEHVPEWHEKLTKLQDRNPERFNRVIQRVVGELRPVFELRDEHPELAGMVIQDFKVEHELRQKAQEYRKADEAGKRELDERIQVLVALQMDLRMQRRRAQLEVMAKRLQREQQRLQEDARNLDTMIANRIEQIKHGDSRDRFEEGDNRGDRPRSFRDRARRSPRGESDRRPPDDRPRKRRFNPEDNPDGI